MIFKAIKSITSNHSNLTIKVLCLSATLVFLAGTILSQNVQHTAGSPDRSLRGGSRVNPATLGVEIEIPLQSYAGRAGTNLPVSLFYSSKLWDMKYEGHVVEQGNPTLEYSWVTAKYGETIGSPNGWRNSLGFPALDGGAEYYDHNGQPCDTANNGCGNVYIPSYVRRIRIKMPDGSVNEFRADDIKYPVGQQPQFLTYYSVDGSRMRYVDEGSGQATLYLPDGSRYLMGQNIFIDRNGNKMTYQSSLGQWTDTLGRTISLPILSASTSSDTTYTPPGLGGTGNMTYTFRWRSMSTVLSANQTLKSIGTQNPYSSQTCTGLFSNTFNTTRVGPTTSGCGVFNPIVLAEIEMPGGGTYKFFYNEYGEIAKVIYPTGAYERFRYEKVDGLNIINPPYDQTNRGVRERWVSEDGTTQSEMHWDYTPGRNSSNYAVTTTAPDGTKTESLMIVGRGATNKTYGFDDARMGMPQEERFISASNQMLRRTLNSYLMEGPRGTGAEAHATRDARPEKQISIVFEPDDPNNALMTLTTNEYDSHTDLEYFAYLNVKRAREYGFVVVNKTTAETANFATLVGYFTGQNPVSIKEIDYLYDANYKARSIVGLTSEVRVMNPANPTEALSKSQIIYDQTTSYPVINTATHAQWQNPNSNYRANPTTMKTWVQETSSWIETHAQFDNFGNLRKQWDSSGDPNRFIETEYSSQYGYAYPTKIKAQAPDPTGTHGMNTTSEVTKTYDFTTGLTLSITDANGQITTTEYDSFLRPKKIIPPTGGAISEREFGVPDANGQLSASQRFVKVKKQIDGTNWDEAITFFDGLGRIVKTQKKDAQGDVFAEIQYDSVGRVKQVSNPFRQGEQKLWSKPRYDVAGRVVEGYAPSPDGQTGASIGTVEFGISTASGFVGMYISGTDASGRKARSITNALGQVVRVDEATANNILGTLASPSQSNVYTYNEQGELVKVQQGQQSRYFMYDSLGRLIRVRQPEQIVKTTLTTTGNPENNQWTAGFTYDNFGNVITATDAKGTVITNSYDNVGRVKTRTYSDGTPQVSYYYDGKGLPQAPQFARGKLTKVSSSVSESRYTDFDKFGRMVASQQYTDGKTYDFGYKYNASGDLIEETYPSGRVVKNHLATDGGLAAVSSKTATGQYKNYVSNFDYSAAGDAKSMMLGNGRWETAQFNARLQLDQIGLGSSVTDTSLWKANYEYGELNADGTVDAAKNTGSVAKQTITLPTTSFVQTYKYDELNRLTEAKETTNGTQNWKQTFGYDRFGNRTSFCQQIGTTTNTQTPAIDPNTNRFTTGQGYVYDFNGNLTQDAEGRTFTFNGDDKQIQVKDVNQAVIGTYYYDGDGARVKKVTNTETTIFVYDGDGDLVAEYSTSPLPQTPTTSYLTTDNLGSPRVITDQTGAVVSRRDFMPFGEELYAGVGARSTSLKYSASGTDNVRQRFTGYEKDAETQLDFAEARMYQNKHGRFTAVDPLLSSASLDNPQTFNRYTYTGNNPINYTDPSGMDYYQDDATGNIYFFPGSEIRKDKNGKLLTNITRKSATIKRGGCINGQCFSKGDYVFFGSNSITVIDPANMTPAQVAQIGVSVVATEEQILDTTSASPSSSFVVPGQNSSDYLPPIPSPNPEDNLGRQLIELGSLTPVLGTPFDLALAGIGLSEGDNELAIVAIAGILPYGDAIKIVRKGKKAVDLINANSKLSSKAQHLYEVFETSTGNVVKTGVSSGKITQAGKSYRATTQVNKWNKAEGAGKYNSRIVKRVRAGKGARQKILDAEIVNADKHRKTLDPRKHRRP
jgi:RHS repeat-associated protein